MFGGATQGKTHPPKPPCANPLKLGKRTPQRVSRQRLKIGLFCDFLYLLVKYLAFAIIFRYGLIKAEQQDCSTAFLAWSETHRAVKADTVPKIFYSFCPYKNIKIKNKAPKEKNIFPFSLTALLWFFFYKLPCNRVYFLMSFFSVSIRIKVGHKGVSLSICVCLLYRNTAIH